MRGRTSAARATFGPAPDKCQSELAAVIENGSLSQEEIACPNEITGKRPVATKNVDFSLSPDNDIKVFAAGLERLRGFFAREIAEYPSNEGGYKATPCG